MAVSAYQTTWKGEAVWARSYAFTGLNAFRMQIPCHVVVYFKNGTILGSEKPESAREVQQRDYLLIFYCLSN